jgi:PQQ-dependent dehydrogenase (methanol/ethanol family)
LRHAVIRIHPLALAALVSVSPFAAASDGGAWTQFGGDPGGSRFSPLTEIHRGNVAEVRLAWATDLGFTGRAQGAASAWGGLLFVSTRDGVNAYDATSGALAWSYAENRDDRTSSGLPRQAPRGSPTIVTHSDGAILFASLPSAPVVIALDAESGAPRWRSDVADPDYAEALRTNPLLAGDVVIVGPTGADLSPTPGRLVALRTSDGGVAWSFDLVPVRSDDPARGSWTPVPPGRAYGVGGGSGWNAGAYDPMTRTVIFGTGQPIPSDRLDPRRDDGPGGVSADLYTASFVALDAESGALRWFHQVVPGDEWSFDQHTVPIITDLPWGGGVRRVAILATTTGFVVLIDAATGAFLTAHAMVEGNVHTGYEADGTPILDAAMRRTNADEILKICPGRRWANVAPAAFGLDTGLLYRPNDLACVRQGSGTTPDAWEPGARPTWLLAEARTSDDHYARWGALTAIDPITGAVAWSFDTPYPHDAGALATAGGLVFAGFADRIFRAFDASTGAVLWSQALSAHVDSAPITYQVAGVQYVSVIAGRDVGIAALPDAGLAPSVAGPATLFTFRLPPP